MSVKTLLGSMAVALAFAAESQPCHDYVLISTRGTTEPQGPSIGFVDMISTTLATLPNGIEYDTMYPANTNLSNAFVGVADITRYITAGVNACPQQKYALLGYSQGASVTDISLQNFTSASSAAYDAIKAVVVIGNPGHVYGSPANVDQNGTDSTRNFTGSYYLDGAGAIPNVYYKNDKVLDICYQGDVVCALPPNGTFAIEPAHLLYGSTPNVQKMGADFLIRKLRGNDTGGTSNSSTTVPSTTSPAVAVYTGAANSLSWSGYVILFASFVGLAITLL